MISEEHTPSSVTVARHRSLGEWLSRDRISAWETARYEQAQRDEYTSKLRFGLATLNVASMVTILNLQSAVLAIQPKTIADAALSFFLGTVLAGYSLLAHQHHLIKLAGYTKNRAMILDRAVSLSTFPIGSTENDQLGVAVQEAGVQYSKTHSFSKAAIFGQWFSAAMWAGGVLILVAAKAALLR